LENITRVSDADITPEQNRAIKDWARGIVKQVLNRHRVDRRFQIVLRPRWADFFKTVHGAPRADTDLGLCKSLILAHIESGQVPDDLVNRYALTRGSRIYVGPAMCAALAASWPLPDAIGTFEVAWALFVLAHEAGHLLPGLATEALTEMAVQTRALGRVAEGLHGPRLDSAGSSWRKAAGTIGGLIDGLIRITARPIEGLCHIVTFEALLDGGLGHTLPPDVLDRLIVHEMGEGGGGPYAAAMLCATVLLHLATEGDRDAARRLARRLAKSPNPFLLLARQIDQLRAWCQQSPQWNQLVRSLSERPKPVTPAREWPEHPWAADSEAIWVLADSCIYADAHHLSAGWLLGRDTGSLDASPFVAALAWQNEDRASH
jgi:hypothetical protein